MTAHEIKFLKYLSDYCTTESNRHISANSQSDARWGYNTGVSWAYRDIAFMVREFCAINDDTEANQDKDAAGNFEEVKNEQ